MTREQLHEIVWDVLNTHKRLAGGIPRCQCGALTDASWQYNEHIAALAADAILNALETK